VQFECVLSQIIELEGPSPERANRLVIGKVVGIHIDEKVIRDGIVDIALLEPIGRLGYDQYVRVSEAFTMTRPKWTGSEAG
jgi:flavin reductase (DIM6/NTAB) family NADH-FMN oxidoreductase RutF